jgi:hypothetical protein
MSETFPEFCQGLCGAEDVIDVGGCDKGLKRSGYPESQRQCKVGPKARFILTVEPKMI